MLTVNTHFHSTVGHHQGHGDLCVGLALVRIGGQVQGMAEHMFPFDIGSFGQSCQAAVNRGNIKGMGVKSKGTAGEGDRGKKGAAGFCRLHKGRAGSLARSKARKRNSPAASSWADSKASGMMTIPAASDRSGRFVSPVSMKAVLTPRVSNSEQRCGNAGRIPGQVHRAVGVNFYPGPIVKPDLVDGIWFQGHLLPQQGTGSGRRRGG